MLYECFLVNNVVYVTLRLGQNQWLEVPVVL